MAVEEATAAAAPAAVAVQPRPLVVRRVRDGATALAAPDGDAPREVGDVDSKATVDVAAGRGVTPAGWRALARAAHLGGVYTARGCVSAPARVLSGTAPRMACDRETETRLRFGAKTRTISQPSETFRVTDH